MRLLLIFVITTNVLFAQDLIYLKNNPKPINAKVLEINSTDIKYKLPSDSFPIMSYLKLEVERIELANGVSLKINRLEDLSDNMRLGSIKFGFFAPIFNHANLSYEGYTSEHRSWEATIGMIGIGRPMHYDEEHIGGYLKIGYKWILKKKLNPRFQEKKFLSGFYFKPEACLGKYRINYDDIYVSHYTSNGTYYGSYTYSNQAVQPVDVIISSVIMNFGYQLVSLGGITLDAHLGFGYYISSQESIDEFNYAFIALGDEIPLAMNIGIKFGYTFINEKRLKHNK